MATNQQRGFSLVELSIVLVILGLLVGGIMTGQNLIRAAELRAVTNEYNHFSASIHIFRDKYLALPGDMTNATSFWDEAGTGSLSGACPGTNAVPSTDQGTCDGNGDGLINYNSPSSNEFFRFWQHLANAGLIEGAYTGVTGAGSITHAVIGENVPTSKLDNAGWTVRLWMNWAGDANWFEGVNENVFQFGGQHADNMSISPILAPEEMWNLDTKMDDGKPGRGKITAIWHSACTDSGGDPSALDSDYMLSETGKVCSIMFKNDIL